MKDTYRKQVSLLLSVLPEVTKEEVFAMHGGTAINLFCLNMPRLSVDIDLTYIPFSENREEDLRLIRTALESIKNRIRKQIPSIHFSDPIRAEADLKLICTTSEAMVKIEVNQINRGIIAAPELRVLCEKAQTDFNTFCEVRTVSQKQLWGGKISAALDRQHPRDLFDVRNMFNEIGYSTEIKDGFLFFLLCGKRPFHEMLIPHRIDQGAIFDSQFNGMSDVEFEMEDFDKTREKLITTVNESLSAADKEFILAFSNGEPEWTMVNYGSFPAVKWKLLNINKLKKDNPQKHLEHIKALEKALYPS
jgi:predicted nucleotidyltransferase component of viral defense system